MKMIGCFFLGLILITSGSSEDSYSNLQAPRFIKQPSESQSIVTEDRTKILQCQAAGWPKPEYRWLKDGLYLEDRNPQHQYIRISDVKRSDAGVYQCEATNPVGTILSESINLTIAYMYPFEHTSESTITVKRGRAAILSLPSIESNPPPVVTWLSDDRTLYGIRYATTPDNKLVVLAVDQRDQKSYRARATNTQLGHEETTGAFHLLVGGGDDTDEEIPEIVVPPQNVETIKGEPSTELACIANYPDIFDIETTWFKDDIPIEETEIQFQFSDSWNRTLDLILAEQSYAGIYKCKVRRKFIKDKYNSASAVVTVLEKPVLVEKVSPETAGDFGRPLSLPCESTGNPTPIVTWYRNGENIANITGHKFVVAEDGSLIINNVKTEDNGMYQCFARNKAGEATAYTWLKVKTISRLSPIARLRDYQLKERWISSDYSSAPVFEEPPSNRTAMDGKDVTFTCKAGGAPNPNVTWYFEQTLIVPSSRLQLIDDGSLFIASIRASDQGSYTCVRANEAGSISEKAFLSVLIKTKIVQPPGDARVIVGHIATMNCKVSSDSSVPYEIKWFHDNREIDDSRINRIKIHPDGNLEIREARASDAGLYNCSVQSPGGSDYRVAKLEIVELPHPPLGVSAFRLLNTPKTVNVSWIPAFDGNSKILNWVIQRRVVPVSGEIPETLDGWITETSNISADQRWYLLTNLKAAAAYQLRVSANNSVGEGPPSKPSNRVILPQEVPSGPPVGVVGSARSSSEIMIAWNPPEEQYRNGIIMGYVVRYRLQGYSQGPWSLRNISNEAQRTYLIEDLITWKDYEIQIAGFNAVGLGIFSKSIVVKTREGAPEAPPSQVKAKALNSTSVQVWWYPPDPQLINGINQGYKLQAWKGDVGDNSIPDLSMTVPPSLLDLLAEQTAVITGLEKYTAYNLTVLCFTSPGDGPLSLPVRIRTTEDVPDQVRNLRFEEVTDRAVKVLWNPPDKENGVLLGYTVRWTVRDAPHTLKVRNVSADITSVRIAGLQPTTHYTFEVHGWTSVGRGPISMATIQSGIEPVLPSAPTRLAVSNIEAFSVVLQFTPGFDGNTSITKWTIQAITSRNSTWDTVYEVSDPDAIAITVRNLTPYLEYTLRIVAHNVVGSSPPSEPTKPFQTLQAAPSHAPYNVTVRAVNSTQLRVRWTPLQQVEWYGVASGYNISYRPYDVDFVKPGWVLVNDQTSNSHIIDNLAEFILYEIKVQAYNDVGASSFSPPALERTRESVPKSGPVDVTANATSSTTVVVRWGEVPNSQRCGIIEGYKITYIASGVPSKMKIVPANDTFMATLIELNKFTKYLVQVLAYTRIGDGALSLPPVVVATLEDVPGPPSNVTFPDVSLTNARILWDEPSEPNGEILGYRISHHLDGQKGWNQTKDFSPIERTYRVMNLEPEQLYMFEIVAKTSLGWGEPARVPVYTTNNRENPQPPSRPLVSRSQIQATQITFSWTPGRDGFAPLRYYTVQHREGVDGPWKEIPNRVDPTVSSYTVRDLKPFIEYQFRIQATNDIGPSGWSSESEIVRTLPAAPSVGVSNVKIVPITTTAVRVDWSPLDEEAFNGDSRTGGYQIHYRLVSEFSGLSNIQREEIYGSKGNQIVLQDLIRDKNYEIAVIPFNSQGSGPPSSPQTIYVGEAVPTGEPRELRAVALSSTEVRLSWQPPLASQQNGDLLGYKIFYTPIGDSSDKEETEVVPASYTSHSLPFMDQYTEYIIEMLAFNPAGDGPRSHPVNVRTLQGLPGKPGSVSFNEITMNSLRVYWNPPKKPNGEILGYLVTYETAHQDENYSKQVKQKVTTNSLVVSFLEEQVTYHFTVRALTIDYGPPSEGNVTTGPQDGSPGRPRDLLLTKSASSVGLQWENGASGKGPILGYYVEAKKKEEEKWLTVVKLENGPQSDFFLSYQNLLPSTTYLFRVISYNRFGISLPVYSLEEVVTPSKIYLEYGYLQQRPFYHQTWFLVTLAAACVVIVTMLVAILCVKSKSYQYKRKCDEATRTLEESINTEDLGFAIELRQSARVKTGTLGRRSLASSSGALVKPPPRPAPASIAYSDDESAKAYDDNDDGSSVTEKPSLSSSESQSSESEEESVRSNPHSFVNHYANVNDTLRQSWKRQRPVRNYSSYTDSEQEGSAVMSLNGGQIVMNNMARSRAPVSGFSSFV